MIDLRAWRRFSLRRRLSLLLLLALVFSGTFSSPAFATGGQYHTVTFAENDSGTDPVSATQTENVPTALTSFSNLSPAFVNSGHTFDDWNTAPNGSGTSYSDGAIFDFGSAFVLYAVWTNGYHTVTFAENASGTDPVSATQTENVPTALTLFASLSPGFVNSGHTFEDWNTAPDGSGTSYSNGAIYDFGAAVVLYAVWQVAPVVTATFNSGMGIGSTPSESESTGSTLLLPSGSAMSNVGYVFAGWNTAANGSGTSYAAGSSIVLNANETFYAQWTPLQFVVTFAPDGGTVIPTALNFIVGSTPISLPTPTYVGENFDGWFTAPSGGSLIGVAGATFAPTQSVTLYAQWGLTSTVQIVFGVNGGSGSAATLSGVSGSMVTLPGSSSLLKSGYTLTSWNTATNGSGTSYALGQSVTLSTSLTLYAQWKKTPSAVLLGAVGPFSKKSATLTSDLKAQVRHLATTIKSKKYAKVTLYGYTAETGVASLDRSLSRERALSVANYLRSELNAMKVKGVVISAAGEGAVAGKTAPQYSRVEVFVS